MGPSSTHKMAVQFGRFIKSSPSSSGSVAGDILSTARRRIGTMAMVLAGLSALSVLFVLKDLLPGHPNIHVIALVLSIVLAWIARTPRLSDKVALRGALLAQFAYCCLISIVVPHEMWAANQIVTEVAWASIIIVTWPFLIPMPPLLTVGSALACASTVPLGLLLLEATSDYEVTAQVLFNFSITPFFSVVIAFFGAKVIYGMSRDVTKERQLGAYRLEEAIGHGGMGELWRASHQMLARPAAVKLIHSDLHHANPADHQRTVLRFEREAQATAILKSPHTVDVYDFGCGPDGTIFYVMELLDGIDLEQLIETHGPMPVERVVYILVQACHSLAEAHEACLVHRDIKPANLQLCRHGLDYDFLKVLDFGLVSLRHSKQPSAGVLTGDGAIPGTPAYLAPELVSDPTNVGPRADLYALGCVGFWMLTGTRVFSAKTALEHVIAHVKEEPKAPSSVSELPIPPELDALVLQLLSKDPEGRPESAAVLRDALLAIPLDRPWDQKRAKRWWSGHVSLPRPISMCPAAAKAESTS